MNDYFQFQQFRIEQSACAMKVSTDACLLGAAMVLRGATRLLDIGTGTGRLLELLAPRVAAALGVDASRAMLALARSRLARPGLTHCAVRLADMYRLPLPDAGFDLVVVQMVLHHAEDPAAAVAEAARVLRPAGRLIVVDLAPHQNIDCLHRLAHRWPGFSDAAMRKLFDNAGLSPGGSVVVPGTLEVRIWSAEHVAADAGRILEVVL